jgi:hypothetical protein
MGLDERRVLLYDVPVTRRLSLLCLSLCVSRTRTVRGQPSSRSLSIDTVTSYTDSVFLFPENKLRFIVRVDYDWGMQLGVETLETRSARPAQRG